MKLYIKTTIYNIIAILLFFIGFALLFWNVVEFTLYNLLGAIIVVLAIMLALTSQILLLQEKVKKPKE